MRIAVVILILIFQSFASWAQTDAVRYRHEIRITPFRILDITNPGIEFGYLHRVNMNWALEWEHLILKDFFGQTYTLEFSGFRTQLQLKRELKLTSKHTEYVALEGYIQRNSYFDVKEFTSPDSADAYPDTSWYAFAYADSVHIQKKIWGINLRAGITKTWPSGWGLDVSLYLGIRFRNVIESDRIRLNDSEVTPIDLNIFTIMSSPGRNVAPVFGYTIRVYWGWKDMKTVESMQCKLHD